MTQAVNQALARQFGLSADEYDRVLAIMGRTPTLTELGIFSVMWSEHCSYKSSRVYLKTLPTQAPWVIHGPGENAGVVAIGDGLAAIFKMESHNHPSFIEPYQGAATGVGGILRDVFTMGARPIANLNALRFGDPAHPRHAPRRGRRGARHRRLRQLRRRAHRGRRGQLPPRLQRQPAGQRHDRRHRPGRPYLPERRRRHRQPRDLCRRQDRPRRHPWRHHGFGRVRRRLRGEAPDGAGRRPVHGEAADRSLPRADGDGRDRGDPGHGRRRADQQQRRDGRQGRRRHRPRPRRGAAARNRHDRLRDDAVGKPGAHADGAAPRPHGRGPRHLHEVGAGFRRHRPPDRHRAHRRAPPRPGRGRHPARPAGRAGAALSPPHRRDAEAAAARPRCRPGRPRPCACAI